jgi:AcrR family transcriptional regulator
VTSPQPKPSDTRTTILQQAVLLFARTGYSGVSMRDIAKAVGISAAALYHHFPDKDSLYLSTVEYACSEKTLQSRLALEATGSAETRLEGFIHTLVRIMGEDADFRRLLQRELLDGDERRLKLLATRVFAQQIEMISRLLEEIAPGFDAVMLVLSIVGMVVHHFESAPLRRYYPGNKPADDTPDFLANHITRLVLFGIKGSPKD